MLELLASEEVWNKYLDYKLDLAAPFKAEDMLRTLIEKKEYLPIVQNILDGGDFPLPSKAVISKMSTQKKRVIYMYPKKESMVLKLLTYLLLRKYDRLFSPNLYSFRPGKTAKDAFLRLVRTKDIDKLYCYKVDVSNYFNSVNVDDLTNMLKENIDDDQLLDFLLKLLCEPKVIWDGKIIEEEKGIMAGTPQASFYANLCLKDLDRSFYDRGIPYIRYSDDIIVFAETEEKIREYSDEIEDFLKVKGLSVNPAKEDFRKPGEMWTFLGFSYQDKMIDISPVSLHKIKGKMRRKARALVRWSKRNNKSGDKAAKAFIRIFNKKLLECTGDNELSWSYWYFPVINTDRSLREIDHYAQDCIRYIATGKRTRSRYDFRYEDMKKLGYQSVVHAYHET